MSKYILAFKPQSLPYTEFKIVEDIDVFFNGKLPLKRNDKIYHRDDFTSELYVVCLSDNYEYLEDNYEDLRYQYLKEHRNAKKLKKSVPKLKTRYTTAEDEYELMFKINEYQRETSNNNRNNNHVNEDDGAVCVDGFVEFGPNRTRIAEEIFDKIRWGKYTLATRSLLEALFGREKLAKSSLTGKQSPAFADKPKKAQLDPEIVADIIAIVSIKSHERPKKVRSAITSKCGDEKKILENRKLIKK